MTVLYVVKIGLMRFSFLIVCVLPLYFTVSIISSKLLDKIK